MRGQQRRLAHLSNGAGCATLLEVVTDLAPVIQDLVKANRILAYEKVLDAYGHVSIRNPIDPGRYLLACSRSPELVECSDILEFHLNSEPVVSEARHLYLERFIHGAIYQLRPEVNAVVHSHAEDVLPFSISSTPLRPVIHNASAMGLEAPVWDIRDMFGDTDLLVTNPERGCDMAKTLGGANVVLMRGHGFTAVGPTLFETVRLSVYLPKNARVLMAALRLGEVKTLSAGEVVRRRFDPAGSETRRVWEYWSRKTGYRDS
jgi:ribulose-5-phosphate 4-epimerase/fuculose-1-phosphate aldolase